MGGWQIFRIQEGWPMSDNEIFQMTGVQTPEDTMPIVYLDPYPLKSFISTGCIDHSSPVQ